jgi:O-antigen ligase
VTQRTWVGNLELHVLHDSGPPGLLGLGVLLATVVRRVWRRARAPADPGWREIGAPAAVAGLALLFAYQWSHGMWEMTPYVYLGFLTAVAQPASAGPPVITGDATARGREPGSPSTSPP